MTYRRIGIGGIKIVIEDEGTLKDSQEMLQNSFDDITLVLKSISHPSRLKILILIMKGALSFQALLDMMGLKKSGLANHLTNLKEAGLVEKIKHGTYRITEDGLNYLRAIEETHRKSNSRKKLQQEAEERPTQ